MRTAVLIVLALLLAAPAVTAFQSPEYGAPGTPVFRNHVVEGVATGPEPTIGIPWNTDSVFYQAYATTMKAVFDENGEPTWTDVTPPAQVPLNLDPMLVADEDTGRVFAGGLLGPCSVMYYTDDDGVTWLPALNMCSGAQFDHQSIGIGPKPMIGNPENQPQLQNAYYCGQLGEIGCSVSLDGGVTWSGPTPAVVQNQPGTDGGVTCEGFHGHWRISRVTGTAVLPVGDCGDQRGMLVANLLIEGSEVGGVTGILFESRGVAGSHPWVAGFDASIGWSRDAGWMYYGDADHKGAFIALSKDEGRSWENLGSDAEPVTWLDVGAFHDPPIVAATFADVQAGDDDRAAYTFIGIEYQEGMDLEYVQSDMIFSCADRQDELVWHYYAAFTFDAGKTWEVQRISEDPVQIGGVYDSLSGHTGGCRNLLDFNDMDIDSVGRVHIGYADGCVGPCAELMTVEAEGARAQEPRLFRQETGRGLFAAHDVALSPEVDQTGNGVPDSEEEAPVGEGAPSSKGTPGFALVAGVAAIAVAAVLRRK